MPTIYQDRVQVDGSASDQTVYGNKIPHGKIFQLETIAVHTYTDDIGDYDTAKYIIIGMESNGLLCPLYGGDIADVTRVIARNGTCFWKEGDRPFFYHEATAATTTHILVVNGILWDKTEFEDRFGSLPGQ